MPDTVPTDRTRPDPAPADGARDVPAPERPVPGAAAAGQPAVDRTAELLRQLALTDEVIGLRARLAETTIRHEIRSADTTTELTATLELLHRSRLADAELRAELAAARAELAQAVAAMEDAQRSWSWRIGRAVTAPVRRFGPRSLRSAG